MDLPVQPFGRFAGKSIYFYMKNLIIIFLSFITVFINAQNAAESGYYRIQNMKTERYVYVRDNTGSINWTALDAEMGAIELWKETPDHSRFSDPGSVIYVENHDNNRYDLQSQGMGIYKMFKEYLTLTVGSGYYQLTVTKEGVRKSLCDANTVLSMDRGKMGTDGSGTYRNWIGTKLDVTTDEWFGITPSIEVDGKFYQPFFADFGFTPVSDDMKVWYISVVDTAGAVLKEFTGSVIPANMPVFIECASSVTAQNKLDLKYNHSTLPADNKLKGVYFNNLMRNMISPDARTEFNSSTMRVLGKMKDGRLGYILSTETTENGIQYLAANQSYLIVGSDCPQEIPVITEEQYAEILAERANAAVNSSTYSRLKEVYHISGKFIGKLTSEEIAKLDPGVYIIDRKKVKVE